MAVVAFIASSRSGDLPPIPLTDAATITIDATLGSRFSVTLAGSRIFAKPTGGVDMQVIVLEITQDGSGSRVATWTGFNATGDTGLPTLTTTAGHTDWVAFIYRSSADKWYAHAVNKNAT